MSNQKRCCKNCKKNDLFDRCTILSENEEYKRLIQEVIDEECVEESDARFFDKPYDFTKNFVCENYKSKYIEYPIEVSKINVDTDTSGWRDKDKGKFVKIRPCNEKYGGKTYLGIYLGELPIGNIISHNSNTNELNVSYDLNPAIFVFEFNEIIFGCQSWWGIIKNEQQLKDISDIDIDNIWYVKALKSLNEIDNSH